MKNRKHNQAEDFKQLKTKIFFRTIVIIVISVALIYCIYSFFLHGRFADFTVSEFQKMFRMEYGEAYNLYQQIFRNHKEVFFIIGIALAFFVVFRIGLNWYINYFIEIKRGIDVLGEQDSGEVSLPPELSSVEKKINAIKHNLERSRLDAELSEQRKNDLIVYLAHDLKTPLASVIGYLNLLKDEKEMSEDLREKYISISLDKAERLEELINEFFEIAKFNLSNVTLQYSTVNLERLFDMLLYEFQPILKERELSCSLSIEADVMLSCDADKIQRVFDNLLRNAAIYSYKGTEIRIFAARLDDKTAIQFTNHGDTIPPDKLDRIFEQFYRLDAARGTSSGGAGLGLAIAKQIVELHKGIITAKSENQITTFEITLPLVSKS